MIVLLLSDDIRKINWHLYFVEDRQISVKLLIITLLPGHFSMDKLEACLFNKVMSMIRKFYDAFYNFDKKKQIIINSIF